MFLGMGLAFLGVGVFVGVVGKRHAEGHAAMVERLRPLSAATFDNQQVGANALVVGVVSPRNPVVFRNFVAYVREELDVTTDSDGDRTETWRSDGRETPRLEIDADGVVMINNEGYSIGREHEVWYDEATLGFNSRTRDGSERYYGLVSGGPVTAFGTVVEGPKGKELSAKTLFGGTHQEYLAWERDSVAFMSTFGTIFGAIGLVLSGFGAFFTIRR
jgi:hypothetical protein